MLSKEEFQLRTQGTVLLDGATGSNLQKAGMPRGCCTEEWILANPQPLISLQQSYAAAGCQILYTPTFQAQPIALERVSLHNQTETVNAHLAALTRSAAPNALVAGDLTTLAAFIDSKDPDNFDCMVQNYARQIRGLLDGGVDVLIAETLMYSLEAEAILTAADMENASLCMFSFTMLPDGTLYDGQEAGPVLHSLESAGAAAVGFNCVAADRMTPYLVGKLRRHVKGKLICKPNAGIPVIAQDGLPHYPMTPREFGSIIQECIAMGADFVGGCCGTSPEFFVELRKIMNKL